MGVLSDVVVADESQAGAVLAMPVPSQQLPGADVKGIDSVKLATLEEILTGRFFEEILPDYDPIAEQSAEGPWVFALGRALVSALSNASDQKLADTAAKWGATEEFQIEDWEPDAVHFVLMELARLAKLATYEKKRLLLWMSL